MYVECLSARGQAPRIWKEEDSHDGSDEGEEVFEDAFDYLELSDDS